jgi:hypothetical protein
VQRRTRANRLRLSAAASNSPSWPEAGAVSRGSLFSARIRLEMPLPERWPCNSRAGAPSWRCLPRCRSRE